MYKPEDTIHSEEEKDRIGVIVGHLTSDKRRD
jgi:hypothetical protein